VSRERLGACKSARAHLQHQNGQIEPLQAHVDPSRLRRREKTEERQRQRQLWVMGRDAMKLTMSAVPKR
jgi:hypothetical protein